MILSKIGVNEYAVRRYGNEEKFTVKVPPPVRFACCVCGKLPWKFTQCEYGIDQDHLVEFGAFYYVIPDYVTHSSCREQFMLNPLVYE